MHDHHWNPFDMNGRGRGGGRHERGGHEHRGGRERGAGGFDPRAAFGFFDLFRRGPRARRGDIRNGILALLAEEPRNGYQIMQELESRSRGAWRPSPGAVYPALAQLEDEGLIRGETAGSGRVFSLTERGRKVATATAAGGAPWESVGDAAGNDVPRMFLLLKQVGAAALQVAQAGSSSQVAEARKILAETRKALYRLLAEDEGADAADE